MMLQDNEVVINRATDIIQTCEKDFSVVVPILSGARCFLFGKSRVRILSLRPAILTDVFDSFHPRVPSHDF
jgi:hypothetical protein